jgi:hypothetical protein
MVSRRPPRRHRPWGLVRHRRTPKETVRAKAILRIERRFTATCSTAILPMIEIGLISPSELGYHSMIGLAINFAMRLSQFSEHHFALRCVLRVFEKDAVQGDGAGDRVVSPVFGGCLALGLLEAARKQGREGQLQAMVGPCIDSAERAKEWSASE